MVRPKLARKVDRTFVTRRRAISRLLMEAELEEAVFFVMDRSCSPNEFKDREELMRTSNYILARLQGSEPA